MPQATDELRARWGGKGGVGDDKAYNHLVNKGFRFYRGIIAPPKVGFDFESDTTDTFGAISFLCDEWDYGWELTLPEGAMVEV